MTQINHMNQKLGELLVGNGIISGNQLDKALTVQKETGGLLGIILVDLELITQDQLSHYLKLQRASYR